MDCAFRKVNCRSNDHNIYAYLLIYRIFSAPRRNLQHYKWAAAVLVVECLNWNQNDPWFDFDFFDYFVSSKVFIWIFWFHEFFSSLIKMIHDDGYILLFRAFASSSLPPLPLALYSRWVVPRGGQTMLRLSGFSLLHHKISLLLPRWCSHPGTTKKNHSYKYI